MDNSTPSTPPADEQARAQAETALMEHGWRPIIPGCWREGELAVGRSHDDKYEASLWDCVPGGEPGMPWRCDVGLTSPDSEKESLSLLGIPRPEEVSALLERYFHILSVGYGVRILDLATETVFVDGRAGVAAIVAEVQRGIAEREDVLREIVAAGWDPWSVGVSLSCGAYPRSITAFGTTTGVLLRVVLWRGGISEIYVEDPGHGVELPIGKGRIPTQDEAHEAYYRELSRGKIVLREVPGYEPRHDEEATK